MSPDFGVSEDPIITSCEFASVDKEKFPTSNWLTNLKDDSIQILTKSLGVSLFGRQLKKSHLLTNPYIPKVKKGKLHNIQSILNNEPINVHESTIVDVDLMRMANNLIFQSEFEQ